MRILGLCLALFGALFLFGCGDSTDEDSGGGTEDSGDAGEGAGDPDTGNGIPLEGSSWDGGTGFDPTERSDKVRVIAFFKPT